MLNKIIENFKNVKVLVIGDVMLDKYIFGDVERISPEAPIPIVFVKKEKNVLGGAANVANNITALGAHAILIGIVGEDSAKEILISELKNNNINHNGIIIDKSIPTIQKTRIIARNQQIVRLDVEVKDNNKEEEICNAISKYINECDIIIVSDYAKGVITPKIMEHLFKESSKNNKKVLIDPKPINKELYHGAYIIKPNKTEFEEMIGIKNLNFIKEGQNICSKYDSNIILTLGEKGMIIFDKTKKEPTSVPTKAREVYDVSGAGDTVIATIALSIASNASLVDSAIIATHAAAIVISKMGTATTTITELSNSLTKE